MTPDLQPIFARPIAHRGLHDAEAGILENSPSAIEAAIASGFGIEVDVQETADGEALVFHDYTFDRLTEHTGDVIGLRASEVKAVSMRNGKDKLWLLQDLFDLTASRVPLVVEIKSRRRRDAQADFVRRVVDLSGAYKGPVCIKSFDPDMLSVARAHNPRLLRGIVADAMPPNGEAARLSRVERFALRHILHAPRTRPHFISYCHTDLPMAGPSLFRRFFGLPTMTWTVKSAEDQIQALRHSDQIVFEGFTPPA